MMQGRLDGCAMLGLKILRNPEKLKLGIRLKLNSMRECLQNGRL